MKIEVKLTQKWSEVAYFYNAHPDAFRALLQKVTGTLKNFDFFALSVGELCAIVDGGFPQSLWNRYENCDVRTFCKLTNSLREGVKQLMTFLENTTPPTTPQERKAANGLMQTTFEEEALGMLVEYFHLHSFEDAQKLSVYEFMMVRKTLYNRRKMEYNRMMIADAEAKLRR